MEQVYIPKQNFKVLVHTTTFNQAKYITDTLEGVAMQQTNFPFVHYVIDDCSTDGAQEVVKNWLNEHCDMDKAEYVELEFANVIIVPHKTNTNLTLAIYLLKRNLWKEQKMKGTFVKPWLRLCRYEAQCEGDDYWTSPGKLQIMFDFMENNPQYNLCHHDYRIRNFDTISERNAKIKQVMSIFDIARGGHVQTATMFYRIDSEDLVPFDFPFIFPIYQFFWVMRLAEKGDIYYFNEPWSVYRVNEGGIWSSKTPREQFVMSFGNVANMIDWYVKGIKRPDVVAILKKRVRHISKTYMKTAIRQKKLSDLLNIVKLSYKYWF